MEMTATAKALAKKHSIVTIVVHMEHVECVVLVSCNLFQENRLFHGSLLHRFYGVNA